MTEQAVAAAVDRRPALPAAARAAARGICFPASSRVRKKCEACGLDYSFADAGDGPAIFVILISGFIVVGAALIVEVVYQPPFWLHALLWGPLILIVTLAAAAPAQGPADRRCSITTAPPKAASSASASRERLQRCRAARSSFRAVHPRGDRRAGRARHLAARAPGLERSADRRARPQARREAAPTCRRASAGNGSTPRATNSAASRSRPSFSPARRRWSIPPAPSLRPDATGPGYWVFAPARLTGGSIVVVNRGFVPEGRQNPDDAQGRPSVRRRRHRRARCAGRNSAGSSRRPTSRARASGSRAIPPRWRRRRTGAPSRRSTSTRKRRRRRAACPKPVR